MIKWNITKSNIKNTNHIEPTIDQIEESPKRNVRSALFPTVACSLHTTEECKTTQIVYDVMCAMAWMRAT